MEKPFIGTMHRFVAFTRINSRGKIHMMFTKQKMQSKKFVVEITSCNGVEFSDLSYLVNETLDCLADSLPETVRIGIAEIKVHTNDTEFLASAFGERLQERQYSESEDEEYEGNIEITPEMENRADQIKSMQ